MATNANFNALIVRIDTATNTLENSVNAVANGAGDVKRAVIEAQAAATTATTQATNASNSAAAATTQATNASNSAGAATTAKNDTLTIKAQTQTIADNLLATAPFQEAPVDGNVYGRKDGSWSVVTGGGGGGKVDSVNGQTGTVVLTAADVGARPSSYVPTWSEVRNKPTIVPTNWANVADKPTTFTPSVHTHAAADVTSGVFDTARLGTGTADSTKVLKGDGTWGDVSAPTGGYPIESIGYNGAFVTQWPLANPNDAAQLSLFGNYLEGAWVEGAALLSSQAGLNMLPAGYYWFTAGSFSGTPFASLPGVVMVERLNATTKRAVVHTFTQPAAQYMWTINGSTVTWNKISDGVFAPAANGLRGSRPTTVFENFTDPAQTLTSLLATLTASGVPGGLTYMIGAQSRPFGPFGNNGSGLMCKWEVLVNYDANGVASSIDQIVTGMQGAIQARVRYATKTASGTPSWNLGTAT